MRVVITGGAGFIGANLVGELGARPGVDVVVVDDLSTGTLTNLHGLDVAFVEGSVTDPGILDRAFKGADSVVHLAALPSIPRSIENPMATHVANASGTIGVLEAARRHDVGHVVVASSSSVYGPSGPVPKCESMRPSPVNPYAVSKLAAEMYALAYSACYGLPVFACRFFNVFGPLQSADHAYAAVIPVFVRAALAGEPLPVNGDGLQTRDFTYVRSVCRLLADVVLARVASEEPVNLAFGSRVSLLDVVREIETVVGRPLTVEHRPGRPGDIRHSSADTTRLRGLFPDLEPVPLRVGITETVAWMRNAVTATVQR